jgi:hypothetical protein
MFKSIAFTLLMSFSSTVLASRLSCLPAVLALATEPIGTPVANNTYWPTISSLPLSEGMAAFWYCQASGKISVAEMHGTPQAIAQYGGLNALLQRYEGHRDAALNELGAQGHSCADPHAKPAEVHRRSDCSALASKAGKAQSYICLNPTLSNLQEIKLCKHLIKEMAAQWPQ